MSRRRSAEKASNDRAPLLPEEANGLVATIRSSFEAAWSHYADGCSALLEAYHGRAWEPLGLPDWAAFVTHTLDIEHLRIPKAQRQAIVRALRDGGLSMRAIATATGLALGTVAGELGPARSNLNTDEAQDVVLPFLADPEPVTDGRPRAPRAIRRRLDLDALAQRPLSRATALAITDEIGAELLADRWEVSGIVYCWTQHVGPADALLAAWVRLVEQERPERMGVCEAEYWRTPTMADLEDHRRAWQWAMSVAGAPDVRPGEAFAIPDLDWRGRP
jgi:hypothetical protein